MITLTRSNSSNTAFQELIRELDNDLFERYHSEQSAYEAYNMIEHIETVVIAYDERKAVGCGCFKRYESSDVEIKRMFVKPSHRGNGISKLILGELEEWALELGNRKAVLETGKGQPEAIGLYRSCGYYQIENYGPYKNMTQSICFEKKLKKKILRLL
jgi:putative acetyltransferase